MSRPASRKAQGLPQKVADDVAYRRLAVRLVEIRRSRKAAPQVERGTADAEDASDAPAAA
jgi:hypothetical protein